MCPDGNPPLTNYVLELEAKVAELEAKVVELEAEVIERTASIHVSSAFGDDMYEVYAPHGDLIVEFMEPVVGKIYVQRTDLRNGSFRLAGAYFTNMDIRNSTLLGADFDGFPTETSWHNVICPDGSNSDDNDPVGCLPLP